MHGDSVFAIISFPVSCRTGPRHSGGRAREHARGAGCPLQPLVGPARSAGTASGWEDAAPLARRTASAPKLEL